MGEFLCSWTILIIMHYSLETIKYNFQSWMLPSKLGKEIGGRHAPRACPVVILDVLFIDVF